MRHLRLLVALAFFCAVFGTIHGQNRGSSRYVPSSSDDFEEESTRAPRAPQVRGVRRQRPTPVPEPAEHPEDVQRSRQAPSTTARRVPSRPAARQQFSPPAPLEPYIPEEPVTPVEPSPAPETRPKRRRTKKRKQRPSTKPIEEKLDIENAAEQEVAAPKAPFDVSSNLSPPSVFQNNAGLGDEPQQFYPPQPATNRLPVENDDSVHQGSRALPEEPLVQYSPVADPPARGSYVPILPPVRSSAEGSSRLPLENTGRGNLDYRTPQRAPSNRSPSPDLIENVRGSRSRQRSPPVEDPSEIIRNSGARTPQRSPSPPIADPSEVIRNSGSRSHQRPSTPAVADPSEIIRNSGAWAPQNNIFRNDQPEDPEVRLRPEDLLIPGAIGYNNQPEESPVLNRFEEERKSIEDLVRGEPVPSNRLPSPPEQDSYPYLDSSAVREPSRSAVPSRSNVEVPTRNVPPTRGASRTETEPQDTVRGVTRYQPPLQRSSSRSNAEDSDTPTRSRSPQTEAPTRTRGPTRNRQEPPSEAPTRIRGSTRHQAEGEATPTRTRDQPSRSRSGQRYQPEPVESDSRINTRRQPAALEEQSPTDRVRSSAAALPSPYPGDFDQNPVRQTLRSRPQFDAPEALYEEPVYEEPIQDEPAPFDPEYQPEAPVQRAPPRRPEQPVQRAPQRPDNSRPDTRSRSPQQQNPRSQPQYEAPRRDAPRPQYEAPRRDTPRPQYEAPRREQSAPPPRQQPPKARQQEASARPASKFACPEPYGFFADPVQCDKYYECRNGTAVESLCEDGLAFNEISAPKYLRCDSLRDVDCAKRPQLQEARSTKNCPRRFGLYPHESDCTKFWNCIDGTASEVQCPAGLTYNDDKASCDWADLVKSSCKTEDLLGFSCPQDNSYDLQAGDGVYTTYPHPDNCQQHFVCLKGKDGERRPRLLSCNEGLVYSTQTKSCTRPDNVPGCEEFYGPRPKRKPAREEPEAEEPKPRRTQTRTRTRN